MKWHQIALVLIKATSPKKPIFVKKREVEINVWADSPSSDLPEMA
jgi:hypothetical protein